MEFINKNPALLLVDIQKAFLDKDYPGGKRNNHDAELICGKILEKWRELGLNVIHVRHSSINPDSKLHESKPGFEFNDFVKPKEGEIILTKNVNSAFIGTGLDEILKNLNVNPKTFLLRSASSSIKDSLRKKTNEAYEKGIFGAPSFVVNNKIFWGQDRLEFALVEANK